MKERKDRREIEEEKIIKVEKRGERKRKRKEREEEK